MWLIVMEVINAHEIFYEDFVEILELKIDNYLNRWVLMMNDFDLKLNWNCYYYEND